MRMCMCVCVCVCMCMCVCSVCVCVCACVLARCARACVHVCVCARVCVPFPNPNSVCSKNLTKELEYFHKWGKFKKKNETIRYRSDLSDEVLAANLACYQERLRSTLGMRTRTYTHMHTRAHARTQTHARTHGHDYEEKP